MVEGGQLQDRLQRAGAEQVAESSCCEKMTRGASVQSLGDSSTCVTQHTLSAGDSATAMSTPVQMEQGVSLMTGSFHPNKRSEMRKNHPQKARGQWANKAEYLLSVLGHIVGLGNVWRFPYLCYRNGGGVFLVPFLLFLTVLVIPLFLLETSMGQYTSLGGVMAWRNFCPLFGGVGFATHMVIVHGTVTYVTVLGWALFYLVKSFNSPFPWSHCNNTWNTENCFEFEGHNLSMDASARPENATSSVAEFWEREVLRLSDRMEDISPVNWRLALCMLGIWIICYFSCWKGVKSTGKVVYFTATFPYVTLLVLLIRGVTLPGASEGIVYYLKPDHTRLADPQVWVDAATQILFSSGVCMGSLTGLGSYNRFNNDCLKDCFTLCLLNSFTSFVAGFAVFAVLGFMAHEQGADISEVAQSGPGLAFIVFPRAIAMMPLPQLWGVCFFLMIILLGLDSQFASFESLMASLSDVFPAILEGYRRELVLLLLCVVSFLLGLIMITPGGFYMFQIYDYYVYNGPGLLMLTVLASTSVGWMYGAERYCDLLQSMIGYRPSVIFKLCWRYLTPALCIGIFLASFACLSPISLVKGLQAPGWAVCLGWFLSVSTVASVPLWATYALLNTPGTLIQRICHLRCGTFTPSAENKLLAYELQPSSTPTAEAKPPAGEQRPEGPV
ncbi:hypothetical protein GJAV_G00244500 [Gymnothorax javanicus]|nr:hypothetical protein GJAV_G00244500 [Gymnothorax javanicus]